MDEVGSGGLGARPEKGEEKDLRLQGQERTGGQPQEKRQMQNRAEEIRVFHSPGAKAFARWSASAWDRSHQVRYAHFQLWHERMILSAAARRGSSFGRR